VSDRDEMALLIGRCVDRHLPGIPMGPVLAFTKAAADALIADGWIKPRPMAHAVVLDADEEPIVWRCACDCECEDPAPAEGELCSSCDGDEI
jgi:hypothetical protein